MELLMSIAPWLTVLLCIASEAFFAASELSIVSADRIALDAQASEGDTRAERVLWFKSHPDQLFGTTLLGTNISTVTGSTIATLSLMTWDPHKGEWYAMLFMSPLVLMGGEIIPKSLAQLNAIKMAKRISSPLYLINRALSPLIWLVSRYTQLLARVFKLESSEAGVTRDELVYLVSDDDLELEEEERELISRIFEFKDLNAEDVMIPFADVQALPLEATVEQGVEFIREHGFSRIPVYEERMDRIVGVVHHLDLLKANALSETLSELMRPVMYAAERQEVDELLPELKRASASLVIVVDEFGSAVGLITLEDLIEEIVGDIDDEFDQAEEWWRQGTGTNQYLIEARAPVEEVSARFNLSIPESSDYDTIAGYAIESVRRIPSVGDLIETPSGVSLLVTKASEHSIEELAILSPRITLRVRRPKP
jgi:CBS domain containing-hemolysin-like protein